MPRSRPRLRTSPLRRRHTERLRRWWRSLRGACPLCGTHLLPTGLDSHLRVEHVPAELAEYLEELL